MSGKYDEWIFGDGVGSERTYVFHSHEPRFIGELFDSDDPDGILSGFSYELENGQVVANLSFIDEIPDHENLKTLLSELSGVALAHDVEIGV